MNEPDTITKEDDQDQWHEVKGQEEETEREMVKVDEWKAVSESVPSIEEVDAGAMDMDISEDEERHEEREDVEQMLDVTQEVEDEEEEDELERTAIEMEEDEKKEEEKEKKAEKKLEPTVTRGEILSTIFFILLMAGVSYSCVVCLRPTKSIHGLFIFSTTHFPNSREPRCRRKHHFR